MLFLLSAGTIIYQQITKPKSQNAGIVEKIVVTQKVNDELKKYKTYQGQTALNLLLKSNDIIASGQGKNAFVLSIDGKGPKQNKNEFWAFYVNGRLSNVGAGNYILKQNDKIEWKLETY